MKKMTARFAAAAALATGLALGATPGNEASAMTVALTCKGELFGGDYLVKTHPSFDTPTAEYFNRAAGEEFVHHVERIRDNLFRVMPKDAIDVDCEDFMKKMEETGLVEYVEPNWIMQHMSPN